MRILNPPKKRIVFYIQKGAGILDACAFSFPSRRKTASIIQDAFRDLAFEVSNIHYLPAQPGVFRGKGHHMGMGGFLNGSGPFCGCP